MIIKRIPLFIVGLLYGALINASVLGLGYGIYASGIAIGLILRAFCETGVAGSSSKLDGIMGAVTAVVIVGAAVTGFMLGITYGLLAGSWHCAMDFYNNGLLRGLSSPFRFLSARWSHDINNDSRQLGEYYKSTDLSFLEQKKAVEIAILKRAEKIHQAINNETNEGFPNRMSQLIAEYDTSPPDIKFTPSMPDSIARTIEENALPQTIAIRPANTHTAADFFTAEEAALLIHRHPFFAEQKGEHSKSDKPSSANTPQYQHLTTFRTLRRSR